MTNDLSSVDRRQFFSIPKLHLMIRLDKRFIRIFSNNEKNSILKGKRQQRLLGKKDPWMCGRQRGGEGELQHGRFLTKPGPRRIGNATVHTFRKIVNRKDRDVKRFSHAKARVHDFS